MTINAIENLTYSQVEELAEEKMTIKEHTVFFVDCGEYFGYSALVFYGDMHIYHANDYALHHSDREKSSLKEWYIKSLNNILFTDEEMHSPLTDYSNYNRRSYYLRNYYSQRKPYISCWRIKSDSEEKENTCDDKYFSAVTYSYYDDLTFVNKLADIAKALEDRKAEMTNSYDYWYSAFKYEFSNYECYYAWDNKYIEVAESLADDELNEVQEKAFNDAKRDYEMAMEKAGY